MRELEVRLKNSSYRIIVENYLMDKLSFYINDVYKNKRVFILTDDVVAKYYLDKAIKSLSDKYVVDYVIIPHGENSKVLERYAYVCEELLKKDIRRNELLIALGGGVIGDLCGFVAATLYRGIPYVGIPTSLLSQMDSSIGGKTGIDFYNRKNILGAFKQPSMVLIDPNTLKTLDNREFNNGMGELIKHGAIGNKKLLDMLKDKPQIDEDIIVESLFVKKSVVEIDEFDLKERMLLNFGHTFGHAIELKYGYKHGEAVAIGMLMAIKMGEDLNVTPKECYDVIFNILKLYELPTDEYNYKDYLKDVFYDKKNIAGTINFIFLNKLGNAIIYKMTEEEVKRLEGKNNSN
ncbi:MAG: 3-dehydroquinate synthase [Acholeplasmatales bacterium]|nr:3-dehydroquinate synthase [Acholeplasmatales bacterium]